MSNLRINIRILLWHFQVNYDWKVKWLYNRYHKGYPHGYFKIYEFKLFTIK